MGQEASTAGAPGVAELRREIEHTREELGDTVAALVEKTDVKARAKERVRELNPVPIAVVAAASAGLLIWRASTRE